MAFFENRIDAGKRLAEKISEFKKESPLVLAIPRGGVPVAKEVAARLKAPMELFLVKKIGAPDHEEFAVGAVSEDGEPWLNVNLIARLGLDIEEIKDAGQVKFLELSRQMSRLRGAGSHTPVAGRNIILVDDGVATGATVIAAIHLLRHRQAKTITVAVPLAPPSTLKLLNEIADEVICLQSPDPFQAVGHFYRDFGQVSDQEVLEMLAEKNQVSEGPNEIKFHDGSAILEADLNLADDMKGLVIFAHGSGSSRHSPRNVFVAKELNKLGFGTLLVDLLTEDETKDRKNVFDIELLTRRLLKASEAAIHKLADSKVPLAYFGASTGAAAAIGAAAKTHRTVFAVVSRGGRPDLAGAYLGKLKVPTLLIVGGADHHVLQLNQEAAKKMMNAHVVVVPNASHLFEESGALAEVVEFASDWFLQHTPKKVVSEDPQEAVLREIKKAAHPVKNEGSWDTLIQTIAKSRVVMLGEATHGTAEFYSLRRMISEKLITEYGFSFIAVEGDWPDCQRLNDYIQGKSNVRTAKDIMRKFHRWPTWMWANDEVAPLIEWMQGLQVGFYGLDVYSLFDSLDYVKRYAAKLSPDVKKVVTDRYACFEPFQRNEIAYARFLTKFSEGCRREVLDVLGRVLRLRMEEIGDNAELFNAQQNARIVADAEEYYRAMIFGGPDSWNVRDHHMMNTLEALLNRHPPGSKCIIWAHNSHIGDYHATDMLDEGYVNLGGLAREKFGMDQVSLVGFGTYQGEVLASPAWDGPELVTKLSEARPESFEFYCHKASESFQSPRFYMLFDEEVRKSILGARRYGHRAVGVVYEDLYESHGRNYVPTTIAKRYDAFVYVDKTSALRAVPTIQDHRELPETWPGGV